MTPGLYNQILDRLTTRSDIDDVVVGLVDAACRGDHALEAVLSGPSGLAELGSSVPAVTRRSEHPRPVDPAGAYLHEIEVAGFRGVGPATKLCFAPGPGLTLLLGRNGSGKSSFSEGLETLLTGTSKRWSARQKEWQLGWRNLHTSGGAHVEATFYVQGSEPIVVRRIWKVGAELDDAELRVRRGSQRLGGLEAIGWTEPLATFRPFLCYSELGAVLEQPSRLYDPLKSILGLEELTAAVARLGAARKARDDRRKASDGALAAAMQGLRGLDDPRARACLEALSGKKRDLDAVERVVLARGGDDDVSAVTRLRRIAALRPPALESIEGAVAGLRGALAALGELSGKAEAESAGLARILEHALDHVGRFAGPCPVCRAELPDGWEAAARERLDAARSRAGELRKVAAERDRAIAKVRALVTAVPPDLLHCQALGLDTAALAAWERWADLPSDAAELSDHVERHGLEVAANIEALGPAVRARLEAIESAWAPVARALAACLAEARAVAAEQPALAALKKAEKWLKDAEVELRDDRFKGIASRSQEIWALLRQDSNVELDGVKLEGTANRRRVVLDVKVDGTEGVGLGVMSQGELNALALSLFLPRATRPESPFHFVVVDDPVQAMDPHKVDGLAMVLAEVARERQVIVLTHDSRLFEAIRRLGIEATVLDVQRRARSVVELRPALDPVERHLQDALHCAYNADTIGPGMAGRTVPTFCRMALEAACSEAFRRRRLARGERHLDVEQALEAAPRLMDLLALAVHDDAERTGEVYAYLNNAHGRWAVDLVKEVNEAAHDRYGGDLRELVARTRTLAGLLRGKQ